MNLLVYKVMEYSTAFYSQIDTSVATNSIILLPAV